MSKIFIDRYTRILIIVFSIITLIPAAALTVYLYEYGLNKTAELMLIGLAFFYFICHRIAIHLYERHLKAVYREMYKNSMKIRAIRR